MVTPMDNQERLNRYQRRQHRVGQSLVKEHSITKLAIRIKGSDNRSIGAAVMEQVLLMETMVTTLFLAGQYPIIELIEYTRAPFSKCSGSFRMEDGFVVGTFYHAKSDFLYYFEKEFTFLDVGEIIQLIGRQLRVKHNKFMSAATSALMSITDDEED